MAQLPKNCRLFRAINPAAEWSWNEIYLADLVDTMHTWLWMNSKDGKNRSKRPKTVVPNYITRASKKAQGENNRAKTGQVSMDIDDIKNLLERRRNA